VAAGFGKEVPDCDLFVPDRAEKLFRGKKSSARFQYIA
jgi:hypothetical protein